MASTIQIIQDCYNEFSKGNLQGITDLFADDIILKEPGYPQIPYAGTYKGREEVVHFFAEMNKTVSFTFFEPRQFLTDGNKVVVKGFSAGKSNLTGKIFETEWVVVWEVENEKVKSYQAFLDTFSIASALK